MSPRRHFPIPALALPLWLAAAGLAIPTSLIVAGPADPVNPGPGEEPAKPTRLSEEDREHLRKVLAEVWQDEAVIAAREEVHAATENYREALQKAVARIDPSAVELMSRLHQGSKSQAMRHKLPEQGGPPWMSRPLPSEPRAAVELLATHEAEMRGLQGGERERFLKVARATHASGALDGVLRSPGKPNKRPGNRGAPNRKEIREQLLKAMRAADPWAASVLDRPLKRPGRRAAAPGAKDRPPGQ